MADSTLVSGWYGAAEHKASPYFNARPHDEVSLIVIHNISLPHRVFGTPYIHDLFVGQLDCTAHPTFSDLQGLEVSSHFLIRRDGAVAQYVSVDDRAWHAGISVYGDRQGCNDFAVGIELEGADDVPFELDQYDALSDLVAALIASYPLITPERIVGHSDIAPGRKTDPGPCFNWQAFRKQLSARLD